MELRFDASACEVLKFDAEVQQFLAGSMIARVATISPRGTPQIMPLYFVCFDGKLYMNNAPTSPTVRNILARPEVVLLFDADRGPRPDRCLRIVGVATFREDAAIVRGVSLRAARKYYLSVSAVLSTLRNARKLPTMRRYRAERTSGMIEVVPETAEFLLMPERRAKRPAFISPCSDPAERSALMRIFYSDWHPTLVGRWTSRLMGWWSGVGLPPRIQATLEVRGRTSGRIRLNPVAIATVEGNCYLVSMLGPESDWVKNVESAHGDAVIRQGGRQRVRLVAVPPDERPPVLREYVRIARSGRRHFPLPVGAPLADFSAIAGRYPVYRIDPV